MLVALLLVSVMFNISLAALLYITYEVTEVDARIIKSKDSAIEELITQLEDNDIDIDPYNEFLDYLDEELSNEF